MKQIKQSSSAAVPILPVNNQVAGSERKRISPELWYACAGPLVTLPPVGSLVVYFPQGHSEQVAASMQKDVGTHVPSYPTLPSNIICLLHNVTMHVDPETDEVYAQMTLQPVNTYEKEALLALHLAQKVTRPHAEFFCKILTASDTSTHGGFSVPRRAAEKIFLPLDFTMQPPAQELQAKDLHENIWTFRHIYRGQPKRHLLTTGWSLFVSGKRLFVGDSVLFARDEKQQLLLGIRRVNKQPTNTISSSVLSSDSMHIGILAAAAHAVVNNSPFTVFYNPRTSPSEFVIPLTKYNKAVYSNQISLGMRFQMVFETEDSGTKRYMGTITGISDLDPIRWKNSQWHNIQVGWDEPALGEKRDRVSIWEIEPVVSPFLICPPPFVRSKRPRQPGIQDNDLLETENLFNRALPWPGEEICIKDPQTQNTVIPGFSLIQWMNMQQNSSLTSATMLSDYLGSLPGPSTLNFGMADISKQLGSQTQLFHHNTLLSSCPLLPQQTQVEQLPRISGPSNQLTSVNSPQEQVQEVKMLQRQQPAEALTVNKMQCNPTQSSVLLWAQGQELLPIQNNLPNHQVLVLEQLQQLQEQQHQQPMQKTQKEQAGYLPNQENQHIHLSESQIQLQLLQKLQLLHQQQNLQHQQKHGDGVLSQPTLKQSEIPHIKEQKSTQANAQALYNSHSFTKNVIPRQKTQHAATSVQLPQSFQNQKQKLQMHQQHQQAQLSELPSAILISPRPSILHSTDGCYLMASGAQSAVTDDVPSNSASPSTNNCSVTVQQFLNRTTQTSKFTTGRYYQQSIANIHPNTFDAVGGRLKTVMELTKSDYSTKHLNPTSKMQNPDVDHPQPTCMNNASQIDYLDTSSSTSVCVSSTDGPLQKNFTFSSFNQPFLRNVPPDSEASGCGPKNNIILGTNSDDPVRARYSSEQLQPKNIDSAKYQNQISDGYYSDSKDVQQEMSSSMLSHSFGFPDMAFTSIDPMTNDGNFANRSSWAPPSQYQRMRTYTKVYKRGAVGRSIDITHYSSYDELKHDLARMFSIEGQLEDRQRIGWKLVYVDHENDVLLVGDDPWEEFVNCVRCIRILSPQEIQLMSIDDDMGNKMHQNQGCSSSDGGDTWRGNCDPGKPAAGLHDHLE